MNDKPSYWSTLSEPFADANGRQKLLCLCRCGQVREVFYQNLRRGLSRSCGCQNRLHYRQFRAERRAWSLMRYRCNTATSPDYANYGGRGIRVCDRWNSFDNFLADMGPKPFKQATIERINVNDGYSPNNCKWVSLAEQAGNKRNNRFVTIRAERITIAEAARKFNIGASTIRERIRRGWSDEAAVCTPPSDGQSWRKGRLGATRRIDRKTDDA